MIRRAPTRTTNHESRITSVFMIRTVSSRALRCCGAAGHRHVDGAVGVEVEADTARAEFDPAVGAVTAGDLDRAARRALRAARKLQWHKRLELHGAETIGAEGAVQRRPKGVVALIDKCDAGTGECSVERAAGALVVDVEAAGDVQPLGCPCKEGGSI
jgi:hypothetical protein